MEYVGLISIGIVLTIALLIMTGAISVSFKIGKK